MNLEMPTISPKVTQRMRNTIIGWFSNAGFLLKELHMKKVLV